MTPGLSEYVFIVSIGACVVLLWRIAAHLEAIRDTLADIARAAHRPTFDQTGETNRLLKLAIKKHWGSAIDLGDDR